MRNWVDKRIRSSEEIHSALRVPVLGVVPRMSGRRSFAEAGQSVHLDPRSTFAEAFRAIRTGVFFGTQGGKGKKLVITSPESGDGKTMTVSNLAIAIAQAGQRTLIIDADLRNPAQHKIFGIDNDLGLVNLLSGSASLKEAVVSTEVANLHVLPSGPVPLNPSELLSSQSFLALLEELATRYDYVIIDSPPVLSVTDAGILGAVGDMTVLVLRWNRSTAKAGQDARDVLLSVGARIFGGIVNDVPRNYGRPAYYYGKPVKRAALPSRNSEGKQLGVTRK
jgi:capsular exopolysaccharide synthesis family protein